MKNDASAEIYTPRHLSRAVCRFAVSVAAALILLGLSSFGQFVVVGDPNNNAASNGRGNVGYEYALMAGEVTNDDYCAFLNCMGAQADTLALWSPLMQQHFMGGIQRIAPSDGKVQFRVKEGYGQRALGAVTWQSAIRYINWLHYNADLILKKRPLTEFRPLTEGDSVYGAYNTLTWTRNPGALFWLPNMDEWQKALYYDGTTWNEDFYDNEANVQSPDGWHEPFPHIAVTGSGTRSHYGTYNQQGNVAEWVEDRQGDMRMALGGSMIRQKSFATFNQTEGDFPDKSIPSFGFRVCRKADLNAFAVSPKLPSDYKSFAHKASVDAGFRADKIRHDKNGGTYILVDYAHNPGDRLYQFKGSVPYDFYIARDELSNAEYCRFLNAVAAHGDPENLWNKNMENAIGGYIRRTASSDSTYTYSLTDNAAARLPVVYVSFFDLARYCNWLHYGSPKGKEVLGITEGNDTQGAYDTSRFRAVAEGRETPFPSLIRRNKGARFFLPDDNEWYKAAYFDPDKLGNRKYHDYPVRSDNAPSQLQANYMTGSTLAIGAPRYYAPVDSFRNAESFFGTRQQGGNVWEYIEGWRYGACGTISLRGGSWQYTEFGLHCLNEDPGELSRGSYLVGGRVAMAADENGYTPPSRPFLHSIYENIMLMSEKKIILLLGGLIFLILLASAAALFFGIKLKKCHSNIH